MTSEEAQDLRVRPRQRVLKGVKVVYGNFIFTVDCTMRDMNTGGARLRVPEGATIPDSFHLFVPETGTMTPARMVWRKDRDIGVAFTDEAQSVHNNADPRLRRFVAS